MTTHENNSAQQTRVRPGLGSDEPGDNDGLDAVVVKAGVGAETVAAVASPLWKVPDGGWGWVIVISALVVSLIVDGLSYTFGLFLGEFERAFDQPKSTIALASSLQVGIYLFIGPIVSALTNRFGCRRVIIFGSFLAGVAFIASSWSNNVTVLILTYGLLGGIGFGLMYLPAIVAVSVYFEERRAVATGIAVCGSGVGTFILAPLTDYLLHEYNWRWTLLILGGLILNGMVFGALVRPLELQRVDVCPDIAGDTDEEGIVKMNGQLKTNTGGDTENKFISERGRYTKDFVSSSDSRTKEEIPLLTIMDGEDKLVIKVPEPYTTSKENYEDLERSSRPAVQFNSTSQLSKGKYTGSDKKISSFPNSPEKTVRPRAQSTSDKDALAKAQLARSHVPVGLSLISLTDTTLNQIREDIHLPLSRKDIHLSGPLPFPDSDVRRRSEPIRGLYIQSLQSIASLSDVDAIEIVQAQPRGLWSCLPKSAQETMEEMLDLSILKEKSYWCVLLGNFFCMLGFYVPFVYVPDRALELGIPEDKAAFLISIIGITNTIGRVLTGVLINFLNLDCAAVTSGALLIAGIVTAICPFCHTYPSLAAVSAIFGVCVAAYISLCSVLLCELLGVDSLTNAFGFVILFRGVACIMGPPIAGALIDSTGIFDPSFYVAGGMIVLGALFHAILLTPFVRRKRF
ncbi:unnamed protein product [Candidula unifasciata]|uniref:Major facilitator superfamily (MFS) profile domain-containing protein n=1 Tax=Candidula unifasciata TaxID=100452 RepID=A0A8S3YSX4_9EUPU|nr:unnamed protein product [Candidula unifasciata]